MDIEDIISSMEKQLKLNREALGDLNDAYSKLVVANSFLVGSIADLKLKKQRA